MTSNNTIISFESPYKFRELALPESASDNIKERAVDEQSFKIRLANSAGRREAAGLLIKKMYSWRGYEVDAPVNQCPNRITLVAETDGHAVGTMTVCFDAGTGLPADENFGDKLDELRAQGRKLCEPSRLAIDAQVPKRVFASMIHISYIYAHLTHGFTDYVIEVNPRHVSFYKRMLGFHEICEERTCTRVNAPGVLLRMELQHMTEQIKKFGGLFEQHGAERSFYPYFFSKRDEVGIARRLTASYAEKK
jgi:hypothetical protein